MFKGILANRTYNEGLSGWYAPLHFLQSFKSVVKADLWNTTSSSGDWDGYFIQKIKNTNYLLRFSQENKIWNGGGYTLYTGKPIAIWEGDLLDEDQIYLILNECESWCM